MNKAIALSHGAFGRAVLFKIDRPFVTHAHREAHLVFYLEGGGGTFTVGDRRIPVALDQAVAINPWEPHSFAYDQTDGRPHFNLTLYINPTWFRQTSRSADVALCFGHSCLDLPRSITESVQQLATELLEDDSNRAFDAHLLEITQRSFEESWRRPGSELQRFSGRFTDYRVRRSIQMMQAQVGRPVEIDQLARDVGLSRPHFFKLFRKQMGVTPNTYLNTLRAERAIDDLLNTNKSVTDIAYDVGFASQASFTRFFSSNVGIAPSDYRRIARAS